MNKISTYTFRDQEVNLLYRNGKLGYTFEVDGKTFGNKVELPSKSIHDVASAAFLLFTTFSDTLDAVKKL